MKNRSLITVLLLLTVVGVLAPETGAFEHRRGTTSVGGQILLGALEGSSEWRNHFSDGMGVTFSLRHTFARNRAYGVTFEQQRFQRIRGLDKRTEGLAYYNDVDDLEFQSILFDYYFYYQRQSRRNPYIVAGIGMYRPQLIIEITDETGTTGDHAKFPDPNVIARLGFGYEYFITRNFSIDSRASGYYINGTKGGKTVSGQIAIGIHLYVPH